MKYKVGRACGGGHSLLVGKPDRKRPLKGSKRTQGDNNLRQATCVQFNIEARWCNRCYCGKAMGIAYYGFVCL